MTSTDAQGNRVIAYTMTWSNEDGGTNSPSLMARWGRTSDIEWLDRVTVDANGNRLTGADHLANGAFSLPCRCRVTGCGWVAPMASPRLISRSCTTGWFDWVWGDLWLTEDALVRLSRGMPETREAAGQRKDRGKGSTVTDPIPAVTPEELDARVSGDKRNRRAPLAEIRTAKLRRGLLNGRVSLVLHDGTRIKWLWLKHDPAHDVLKDVLAPHLR